jgi:hypothetical protein
MCRFRNIPFSELPRERMALGKWVAAMKQSALSVG